MGLGRKKSFSCSSFKNFAAATLTRAKSIGGGTFSAKEADATEDDQHPYLEGYYSKNPDVKTRTVMVVVDSTREAKGALLWALSHALLKHDKLILLHVVKLSSKSSSSRKGNESPFPNMYAQLKHQKNSKDYRVLNSLKAFCIQTRPEVDVELMIVGGRDKRPTILQQANKHSVSLLVLGQPNTTFWRRLSIILSRGRWKRGSDDGASAVVEYCIQNSECMSVAVRQKSGRAGGGYLISTKRQKNFWLLA